MDQLLLDLIGKPKLNAPKVISIVVEDFSLLEDQGRFLKTVLAIPEVKKLPIVKGDRRLVQIGNLPSFIASQVEAESWSVHRYNQSDICDAIAQDLSRISNRSLIFINDLSKIELSSKKPIQDIKKLLLLVSSLKRNGGHFVVMLYQDYPRSDQNNKLLKSMEFISDAMVRVKSCKAGYFKHIWFQPVLQSHTTLLPPKIETSYYTCKIGQDYWSPNLLCFYDKKKVPKNYNLDGESFNQTAESDDNDSDEQDLDQIVGTTSNNTSGGNTTRQPLRTNQSKSKPDPDDLDDTFITNLKPYMAAQNPERSQIFYYPDKDDDFDEDDPDSDLNI